MKKVMSYDKDSAFAIFKIIDKKHTFIGKAKAHPDDKEVASEYTGLTIAEYRANIKRERSKIVEAKKQIIKLNKEIENLKEYITEHNNKCHILEKELDDYIKNKEAFGQSYRKFMRKSRPLPISEEENK